MSSIQPTRFSTAVTIPDAPFSIDHASRILLIGSCFSTSIRKRLLADEYQAFASPFGIVYDALAMADQIQYLLSDESYSADRLLFDGELYHSLLHHGSWSGQDATAVTDRINRAIDQTRRQLEETTLLILTWASTRSFMHIPSGQRAANTHQLPMSELTYEYVPLALLFDRYRDLLRLLKLRYPRINLMVTISPVRYLQDGAIANSRSKSTLHLLAAGMEQNGIWVFPSYEILHDELRDYRFYDPDMIHPSPQAVDLIYERLIHTLHPQENEILLERIRKIRRTLDHRLLFPETEAARRFIQRREEDIRQLRTDYPQHPHLFSDEQPAVEP